MTNITSRTAKKWLNEISAWVNDPKIDSYTLHAKLRTKFAPVQPAKKAVVAAKPTIRNAPLPSGLTSTVLAEVDGYLRRGLLIQAIKAVRAATLWGLKEAKDYCDNRVIQKEMHLSSPQTQRRATKRKVFAPQSVSNMQFGGR